MSENEEIIEEQVAPEVEQEAPEYPKETSIAKFFINEEQGINRLDCELKIDWKTFDVSFEDYFNGTDEIKPEEYQIAYCKVAEQCNLNGGEYTIDCWKNRYTVRKVAEIQQIHYNDMSDEEKAEYDAQQAENERQTAIWENKRALSDNDYKIIKCMEAYLNNQPLPYDIQALKAERDAKREAINELEK